MHGTLSLGQNNFASAPLSRATTKALSQTRQDSFVPASVHSRCLGPRPVNLVQSTRNGAHVGFTDRHQLVAQPDHNDPTPAPPLPYIPFKAAFISAVSRPLSRAQEPQSKLLSLWKLYGQFGKEEKLHQRSNRLVKSHCPLISDVSRRTWRSRGLVKPEHSRDR